jgi:hypothetical protein
MQTNNKIEHGWTRFSWCHRPFWTTLNVQKHFSIQKVPANTDPCCCMPNEKYCNNGMQRFLCNTIYMYQYNKCHTITIHHKRNSMNYQHCRVSNERWWLSCLHNFFISRLVDMFIGHSTQKINTNIYGCRGKWAVELRRRGPWWHPEEISKKKSRVFRLRSGVSSPGYLHRHPYATLDYIRHGITTDFSWHIHSLPFIIINLHNYSPFPIPSRWKPVDGCPTPVHVSPAVGKSKRS